MLGHNASTTSGLYAVAGEIWYSEYTVSKEVDSYNFCMWAKIDGKKIQEAEIKN